MSKKRGFRLITMLTVCILLVGSFSMTAFAYADDTDQNLPVTEATQPEETPQPEPTASIEKPSDGEPIDDEGNAYTRDLLYDKATNKQFITVQTQNGNTFYIVIDYDAPINEEEEQYKTYFLNVVDDRDLFALLDDEDANELKTCICDDKCVVGDVNPEALVCFAQNGYFELYGKDAEKAAPLLGTKVLEKKVRGKSAMPVTGFRESAWVAASKKLWQSGADVLLSKDGDTFKDLKGADYIPVGATLMMDRMKCRIDAVDYTANEVKLTDITKPDKPFKFSEDIAYVRSFVEDAGIAIYDTVPKKPAARESIREKLKTAQKAQPSQPQKPQKLKGKDMEL